MGGDEVEWDRVWDAVQGASKSIRDGDIEVSDVRVAAQGDTAFTTRDKHAQGTTGVTAGRFDVRRTNISRRESGE